MLGSINNRGKVSEPIQVEMRKYEQDVDMAFIENAGRKGHEHDVS